MEAFTVSGLSVTTEVESDIVLRTVPEGLAGLLVCTRMKCVGGGEGVPSVGTEGAVSGPCRYRRMLAVSREETGDTEGVLSDASHLSVAGSELGVSRCRCVS